MTEISKEQLAHDKKVAAEVLEIRTEAEKKGVVVADSYNNVESIRALIDKHEATHPKVDIKKK